MSEEKKPTLVSQILAVMKKVGVIHKDDDNGKYNFSTDAEHLRTVRPEMIKAGLVLYPVRVERKGESIRPTRSGGQMVCIDYTSTWRVENSSGEFREFQVVGSGEDNGDKHTYKAMTGMRKYALRMLFQLASDDDAEQDKYTTPTKEVINPAVKQNMSSQEWLKEFASKNGRNATFQDLRLIAPHNDDSQRYVRDYLGNRRMTIDNVVEALLNYREGARKV